MIDPQIGSPSVEVTADKRYATKRPCHDNVIDAIRNDEKDGNNNFTTLANYLIINGNLNSMNEKNPISFELVSIPYDNDKEIKSNIDNIEFDDYKTEITTGKYRDMEKINNSFKERGINIDEI